MTRAAPARASSAPLILTVLVLAGLQWYVSGIAAHQIRYEELAESIRNVWWLEERRIYDGISSNVGWYGLLLGVYKIAGFTPFTAKTVRLLVYVVGLCAAAATLRRGMSPRAAVVPLAALGLSPTLMYFNTLQTSFGLDVSYAAICAFLIVSVSFAAPRRSDLLKTFAAGLVAALAATSYPTFLLYLPSFAVIWVWLSRRPASSLGARWQSAHVLSALVGFLAPILALVAWVEDRQLLLHDTVTGAGLFRGGGGAVALSVSQVVAALQAIANDMFVRGDSYYFELRHPDFSGLAGLAGCLIVAGATVHLAVGRRIDGLVVLAATLLVLSSLLVPSLSQAGPPGLRRATGILAAFFVLFAVVWQYWVSRAAQSIVRSTALGLCLVVPLAFAFKLPSLLTDVRAPSAHRNRDWFAIRDTPTASLAVLAESVRAGQPIRCPVDEQQRLLPCRYQEVYGALAGWFRWNGHDPVEIRAIDWKTGRSIVLSPALWATYYYPH